MSSESPVQPSQSKNCELRKSQLDWLDDDLMMSEVKKLSTELKSRKVLLDEEELDFCVTTEPTVKSDYHKEIKDGVKEVEIDGKKYRQKFQRHIQLEKHTVKQIFTFSGDEASYLDFDVHSNSCCNSPKIENEIFFNLNAKTILEDMKRVVSPKIVIRSINQSSPKTDKSIVQSHTDDASSGKNEINSFIDKFGQTDFSDLSINKRISKDLRNSFISQWQKTETQSQPNAKCKTISCVERFRAMSNQGKLLHQSTCVQMTRSLIVRSKSSEDEIKSSNQEFIHLPNIVEIPLLFKINVSSYLVYNDKYNPTTEATGKQLSVAAGHIDALIAHACSIGINTTTDYHLFHKAFVVTYPLFIKTDDILERLIKRYFYFYEKAPSQKDLIDNEIDSSVEHIQVELLSAIINLIVQLINHWSRPLPETVKSIFALFCDNLNKIGNIKHNLLIQSSLRDMDNRIIIKKNRKTVFQMQQLDPGNNGVCGHSSKSILDFDSRVIAEQLTLLEAGIFDKLELEDLLNFKAACNNQSLMKCVHFFNKLTFWVKTQLVLVDSEKFCHDREKRFIKFLEILKVLKFHQNFSGYTSILYSLIDFPEKFLSKKTRMKFSEESQFMNLSNKKLYVNAIQAAQPPFIPLLAETFSHLTRLNEIMPTFINNNSPNNESVNFKKMWQYFIIIQYFVVKMHLPPEKRYYQFKLDLDALAFINDFKDALSESQLFIHKERLIRSKSKKLYQKEQSSFTDLQSKEF